MCRRRIVTRVSQSVLEAPPAAVQEPLTCERSRGASVPREPARTGHNGSMSNRVAHSDLDPAIAARLKRDADGLVSAVVQQHDTGEVLMVGWLDDEALHRTLTTGRATYWSRSRQQYWRKGDTSGHVQHVHDVRLDCDGDAVLIKVDQVGAACHTGDHTCFDGSRLPTRTETPTQN